MRAAIGGEPADAAGSKWLRWALIALWLLPLAPGHAGGPTKDSAGGLENEFGFLEAEEVEKIPLGVVSRGPAIPAGQAPAIVDVITADEIRSSGARTLAELLSERVGIDVSIDRVVPRGLNTSPSAAGITLANHRTLLLIDGRPTNDLFFGEFLAGRELPLEYIERIEIIRGPGSALYGTNAMAGVINIVTKDYTAEPGPGAIGEYGSFSTRRVDGFAGAGSPDVNGNFFFRYFASGGANQINRNDNQRQYFGFGRSSLGPLTLESDALDFRQEVPGLEGAATPDDHIHRSRYSIAGRLDPPLGDDLKLTGRVYTNLYQNRLLVASARQNTLLAPVVDSAATNYDERRIGEELALTYRPLDWLSVTIGGEARQEHGEIIRGGCIGSTATGSAKVIRGCNIDQDVYAAFLEDQIHLPYDLTLTAGVRYDDVSISGSRANPRANLLWRPEPRTTVKLGYGEAFRAPSFFELRGAQQFGSDTVVLGYPNLKPEVVRTVEGEIAHSFARSLNVRLSSFFTRGTDMITQQASTDLLGTGICPPCGVPSSSVLAGLCPIIGSLPLPLLTTQDYCFLNSSKVDVLGVEATAGGTIGGLPIPGEIAYGVNYTFQDSKNRSLPIGEPDLPLSPRHKANLTFNYRPVPELSIFWHTRWVGSQFADGAERTRLTSYFNQNLDLRFRITRELEVAVGLYNLFGDDRKEALGVPREPRTVLGSVAYRFASAPALPTGLGAEGREPAALGEARAAVERARAAGAESLDLTSYKEAIAHLMIAEQMQKKGAGRNRVNAAAELSKQAADVATASASEVGVRPTPPPSPPPPVAPTPEPARPPRPTPEARAPAPPRSGAEPGMPPASPSIPRSGTEPGMPPAPPSQASPMIPAVTPLAPTATPIRTATALAPTPTPTADVSARSILLLQSDSAVPIYRDTAARLVKQLPGRVALRDLRGDRDQGIEAARDSSADLVIAVGAVAATVAKQEITNRPILFCAVLNPERYKLSGPNVAGVSFEVSAADQLARMHDALPNATRVGVIYDPDKTASLVAAAEQAAPRLGLQIVKAAAHDAREVDPVFRSLKRDIDVLWVIPDSTVVTRESFELLALQAAESRIPFVAFSESFARQGALLAFYPDPQSVGEQCAALASRLLRGEAPSQIGVQPPARTVVAVNRRIEDQLGVQIGPRLKPDVEIR